MAVVLASAAGLAGAVQAAVMGELGDRVGIVPAVALSVIVSLAACGPRSRSRPGSGSAE